MSREIVNESIEIDYSMSIAAVLRSACDVFQYVYVQGNTGEECLITVLGLRVGNNPRKHSAVRVVA